MFPDFKWSDFSSPLKLTLGCIQMAFEKCTNLRIILLFTISMLDLSVIWIPTVCFFLTKLKEIRIVSLTFQNEQIWRQVDEWCCAINLDPKSFEPRRIWWRRTFSRAQTWTCEFGFTPTDQRPEKSRSTFSICGRDVWYPGKESFYAFTHVVYADNPRKAQSMLSESC